MRNIKYYISFLIIASLFLACGCCPGTKSTMKASIEKLQNEERQQNATWKLNSSQLARSVIPDCDIDGFIKEMVSHVE